MGGAFLLRRGSGFVCYFFYYKWTAHQQWYVNVLEAVAGLTLLVAGHFVSPAPFVSEFGDNNVANSSAHRNATPNLENRRGIARASRLRLSGADHYSAASSEH